MSSRRDNGEGSAPRQRPDGRWEVRIRFLDPLTSKPKRVSVYGATKTEVREKARAALDRIRGGVRAVDSQMSLNAWIDYWLATTMRASSNRESTRATSAYILKSDRLSNSRTGQTPLAKLRPSTIDGWIVELRESGELQESTLLKYFTTLSTCLKGAVRDGLIATNPCSAAEKPRAGRSPATIFKPLELNLFMREAAEDTNTALWTLLRATGMREGEALALTWDDLDFDTGQVSINKTVTRLTGGGTGIGQPKTPAAIRDLKLTPHVLAVLRKHRTGQSRQRLLSGGDWEDDGSIFTTRYGTRIEPRNMLRSFRRIADKAGVGKHLTPHSLRHTVTTALIDEGTPLPAVTEFMGHANVQTTLRIYAHATQQSKEAVYAATLTFVDDLEIEAP